MPIRCFWRSSANQQGSILVAVLAILFILLTLFLSVLTYALSRYSIHAKNLHRATASHLAESGIQRATHEFNHGSLRPGERLHFESPNNGAIDIMVDPWGPFYLVTSVGSHANQEVTQIGVIGSQAADLISPAITVTDPTYPLAVAGNTRIIGDVRTGPLSMTEGRIKGEAIRDQNYHQGQLIMSDSLIRPILDTIVFDAYLRRLTVRKSNPKSVLPGSRLWRDDQLEDIDTDSIVLIENNLLLDDAILESPTHRKTIYVNGYVEIKGQSRVVGPVEFIASGSITISEHAAITGALLYTKDSIVVTDSAIFAATAVSRSTVVVNQDAKLKYPSTIVVIPELKPVTAESGIYLSGRSDLESTIALLAPDTAIDLGEYLLFVDTSVTLSGLLISSGRTDFRGRLNGAVITHRFHYYLTPTTYVNWIKDARINRPELDHGPPIPYLRDHTRANRPVIALGR